jgi:hypothetical protein
MLSEFELKQIAVAERRAAAEERKADALELLAENILQGFRDHATVLKKDVARALENVAGSIANKDFFEPREEEEMVEEALAT